MSIERCFGDEVFVVCVSSLLHSILSNTLASHSNIHTRTRTRKSHLANLHSALNSTQWGFFLQPGRHRLGCLFRHRLFRHVYVFWTTRHWSQCGRGRGMLWRWVDQRWHHHSSYCWDFGLHWDRLFRLRGRRARKIAVMQIRNSVIVTWWDRVMNHMSTS